MSRLKELVVRGSVIVVLLATLVLATGCGTSKEVKLDANNNGDQVELKKGQSLIIELASNPTTGYAWQVAELDQSVLQQTGEAQFKQPDSSEPPLVGAGGVEVFRFEAKGTGQTALKLVYRRAWEEGVEPLETFSIQVEVR